MLKGNPQNFKELYKELNEEFYTNYDVEYFQRKAILTCGMLAKKSEYADILSTGYKIGKIEIGGGNDESLDWLDDYSKKEIVVNSYHCIESFFRLLFAHLEKPECPWLGLIEIKGPQEFKKRVEQLLNREYFLKDHEESITSILLGNRSSYPNMSDDEWQNNKKQMLDLLDRIGRDLLSTPDYNVFKHGGALFSTSFGFNFGDVLMNEEQESFVFLSSETIKEEQRIVTKYSHTIKFMKWQIRFANTMLVTQLMENLIDISQLRLGLKNAANVRSFHTLNLHEMLETGIITNTVSETMFENSITRKQKPSRKKKGK